MRWSIRCFWASVGTIVVVGPDRLLRPQVRRHVRAAARAGRAALGDRLAAWRQRHRARSWWLVDPAAWRSSSASCSTSGCKTPEGRRLADLVKIKLPLAGRIFLSFAVARFCRVLGTLLHNGVPILKALEISRDASGNRVLSEAIAKASENISAGHSLAGPLAPERAFPENGRGDDRRGRGIEHARHGAGRTSPTTWKNAPAGSSTCSSACWSRSC